MRLEEFILQVKKLLNMSDFYAVDSNGRVGYNNKYGTQNSPFDSLYCKWSTGGRSGGSCWDKSNEDPHYEMSGDPEPEFEELDKILEHFCPNITFMQHKALSREIVQRTSYSQNEYYGNYTDYAVKHFKVENLYNYLVSKELLGSPDSIIKKIT